MILWDKNIVYNYNQHSYHYQPLSIPHTCFNFHKEKDMLCYFFMITECKPFPTGEVLYDETIDVMPGDAIHYDFNLSLHISDTVSRVVINITATSLKVCFLNRSFVDLLLAYPSACLLLLVKFDSMCVCV